jgi:cation:H+ antiporter
MLDLLLFLVSLIIVVKAAGSAIRYSSNLADSLHLSKHVVGFLLIAGISVMPETLIAIQSAIQGIPSFGVGTLFGSNVADLSLVFAVTLLFGKGLKVESKILKDQYW